MAAQNPINHAALAPALEILLAKAKHYGADAADAVATHGRSLTIAVRGGELEDVDNSENKDIGLRVMVGKRQACVSSSDMSTLSLDKLAERAVAMAKLAPEDPYCGLADPDALEKASKNLDLFDATIKDPEALKARAHILEDAALSVKGVTQAEGAHALATSSAIHFMTSHGFADGWRSSRHGIGVSAYAEQDGTMERDYDMKGSRWYDDLGDPETVGIMAGNRAIAKLGARQLSSGASPVIFDERVAGSLISALLGAISGPAITRGTSYLKDSLGKQIFAKNINIYDDPTLPRGHGSRPWDGEGVRVKRQALIKDGVLQTWLLNSSTAKQLGLTTTGHAYRGIGSPPGVGSTNTFLENGTKSPAELMADMGEGLLITEMFGPSLNGNTGDYSVGVSGFKIENGERAYPVNEITIAGNLLGIYKSAIPANDLNFDGATVAPTLLVEGLTIAGL